MKKSVPARTAMCAEMKSFQVVLWLRIGRRRHAVPLEQVRDRLMRQVVTEVGQCACNPIVPPTGVLAGHVDDEILDDRIHAWAAPMLTTFGTVALVGDQTTVPIVILELNERMGFARPSSMSQLGARHP